VRSRGRVTQEHKANVRDGAFMGKAIKGGRMTTQPSSNQKLPTPKVLSTYLKHWFIDTKQKGQRWTWSIAYPISRYAIVPTKTFATKAAARRDAYRVIRLLINKAQGK
jgi:hypothetical protein